MNSATGSTVRAAVFDGSSGLTVTEVVLDPPKAGEVEVAITAAGVCHSDLHVVRDDWQVAMPVVLGHEGAGVVTALGEGVTGLELGDHVVLSWVAQCGNCRQCLAGRPWQCEKAADVIAVQGLLFDGTSRWSQDGHALHHYLGVSSFAERVVVPESGAVRVRKDAPLEKIAIIGCAVATGVGAVQNTASVEPGATVAVIGCGGVGLSCIQGARLAQASRIVAVDINPEKLTTATKVGATQTLCTAGVDPVAAMRELEPAGFDFVFDAIGKTATTEQAIQSLGLGGAAVIVGLPPTGSTARFDPLALAESNQRILGSNYGSIDPQADIPRLVDLYMNGEIELDAMISGYRPLDDAAAALDELEAGLALRTLLVMDGNPGTTTPK
jgi:S-(hydroxymethyl)glutathione dehydrogenase / alcohol dehydrogenase